MSRLPATPKAPATPSPQAERPPVGTPTMSGSTTFDMSAGRYKSVSAEFKSPFSTPSSMVRYGNTTEKDRDRYSSLESRILVLEQELENKKKTISKLESESIQGLRAVGDVRTEEDGRRNALVLQCKKEVEAERERTRQAQAELANEHTKRAMFEQRATKFEMEVKKQPALEARIYELETSVQDKLQERNEVQKKASALEKKVLELQNTNAVRVLEGKVAALQILLDTRTNELEEQKKQGNARNLKVEDLKESLSRLQTQLSAGEKENGEKIVIVEEQRREIDRMESKIGTTEVELEAQIARSAEIDREKSELEADRDQREMDMRVEIRAKLKQNNALELERAQLTDKIVELEMILGRSQNELEREKGCVASEKREVAKALSTVNELEGTIAKENVLSAGLRHQLERQRLVADEAKKAMQVLESHRLALDQSVHELTQECSHKAALEEQLTTLRASFERQELDVQNEMRRHEDTKARLVDAQEKLQGTVWMQQKIKDLENASIAKDDVVAKLKRSYETKDFQLEETRRELDREVVRLGLVEVKFRSETEDRIALEERLGDLEQEAIKRQALEGKVRAFERQAEESSQQLAAVQNSESDGLLRIRELEGAVEHLRVMEDRASEYHAEKVKLQELVSEADDIRRELERDVAANESRAKQKENELEHARANVLDLEQEMSRLKRAYMEKAILEPRVAELEQSLASRTDEIDRLNTRYLEVKERATTLEEELTKESARCREIESRLAAEVEVVEAQQTEAGRTSVYVELVEREKTKLEKDLEWRVQQTELSLSQASRLQEELTNKTDLLGKIELREQSRNVLVGEQARRIADLDAEVNEVSANLVGEKSRTNFLENRIVSLESDVRKNTVLDGKIRALENACDTKDGELTSVSASMQALKIRVKELEAENEGFQKLEARVKDLRGQLAQQTRTIETLEMDDAGKATLLFTRNKELQTEREGIRTLQQQLAVNDATLRDARKRMAELEIEVQKKTALDGRIRGLEEIIEVRVAEVECERMANAELRDQLKATEQDLTNAARLDDVVKQLEAQVVIKNEVVTRLEQEEGRRRSLIDRQQKEIEQLHGQNAKAEDDMLMAKALADAAFRASSDTVAALQGQLDATMDDLRSKTMELNKLQVVSLDLNQRLSNMDLQAARTQERMKNAEQECWNLKDLLGKAEHDLGMNSVETENLNRKLEIERINIGHLMATLTQEKEMRTVLDADAKQSSASHTHTEKRAAAEIRAKDAEMQRLQDDIRDLKAQIDDRGLQLKHKSEEYTDELTQRRNLEDQIRHLQEDHHSHVDSMNALTQHLQSTKRSLEESTKACVASDAVAQEKEKVVSQTTVKLQSAERRLKDEENRSVELAKQVRSQAMEMAITKEAQQDNMRLHVSEQKDVKLRIKSLTDERDKYRQQIESLRADLGDATRGETEKLSQYEATIAALTQKGLAADEIFIRLRDTTAFMDQLKQENSKLREDVLKVTEDLEASKSSLFVSQQQRLSGQQPTPRK